MRRRTGNLPLSQRTVPTDVSERLNGRVLVVMGSPAEVVNLLQSVPLDNPMCWQVDLFQAQRLRESLAEAEVKATVTSTADLWDLPAEFDTAVYMAPKSGERELKIDLVEQAYHVLTAQGKLLVWSPYESESLFPNLMKKVFGRVHNKFTASANNRPGRGSDTILWAHREGERIRRRHEMTFQSKILERPSCRFISRPGTFSYGRFDEGARALIEVAEIAPGQRVLDLGCGCGTNGVFAAQATGRQGFIAFVDSNVRAIALTELNAKSNGVERFQTFATATVEGPQENSFDVVLANPPYYASGTVADLFIERGRAMLTRRGKFYLVTRMPNEVIESVQARFRKVEVLEHRGYSVIAG